MSLVRVLKEAAIELVHTFYVNEAPTSASGPVTVAVKRLDGTAVVSGSATLEETGVYSYVVPGYADLDTHTVDWTGEFGGSSTSVRDVLEIVGAHYFTIPEVRGIKPPLNPLSYSLSELTWRRIQVEQECERITGTAFVPRFTRLQLNGNGTSKLVIPDINPRAVRAVLIGSRAGATKVALGASSLAAIAPVAGGVLVRDDGQIWPMGYANIIVEYEYGRDFPPEDLRFASMRRLRSLLTASSSAIPDRTLSFTQPDGGVYRLTVPTARQTGIQIGRAHV